MTATLRRAQRGDAPTKPPHGRRNLRDRITIGHVAPVVLAVLAALLVAIALNDRSSSAQVPVASGPIAVGAAVDAGDTHLVPVHSDETALRAGLMPASTLSDGGWVAAVPIVAGDPITRSEVARAASGSGGLGAMSVPVPISNADGGAIVAGDRVDVIAGSGAGAEYVAQGLRVLRVPAANASGVLATDSTEYYVVVAVDRATALRLAAALAAASGQGSSIEVVRTTGETVVPVGGDS